MVPRIYYIFNYPVSYLIGIEVWCNGSTTDFGSACPGSSPGTSTKCCKMNG